MVTLHHKEPSKLTALLYLAPAHYLLNIIVCIHTTSPLDVRILHAYESSYPRWKNTCEAVTFSGIGQYYRDLYSYILMKLKWHVRQNCVHFIPPNCFDFDRASFIIIFI